MMPSVKLLFKKAREKKFSPAFFVIFLFLLNLCSMSLFAAPNRGPYYQDDKAIAIQEMRDSIEDVRHQVNNHEAEIRMCDEKLKNVDVIIESVRDQLSDSGKFYKEQLKGSSASLENKISVLETTSKVLVADLRKFKVYSNETTTLLTQYQQKIIDLEKIIERQNQNIEYLQAAMGSLMEAIQGKPQKQGKVIGDGPKAVSFSSGDNAFSNRGLSYMVKNGDSLEKIARANRSSIKAIKEANGLTTDRIIVGKTLIIPVIAEK